MRATSEALEAAEAEAAQATKKAEEGLKPSSTKSTSKLMGEMGWKWPLRDGSEGNLDRHLKGDGSNRSS